MLRKHLLTSIRVAGYHNDTKTGTRLFIENRISRPVYNQHFLKGREMRANGVKCDCSDCKGVIMEKPKHNARDNERFVGNIPPNKSLIHLVGVDYRIGKQAFDIHGEKLDISYMLPLYVKKGASLDKYNAIKMRQIEAIHRG